MTSALLSDPDLGLGMGCQGFATAERSVLWFIRSCAIYYYRFSHCCDRFLHVLLFWRVLTRSHIYRMNPSPALACRLHTTCTCISMHPSFIASCACTCECACSTLMRATLNWTGINWEAWRLGEKPKDSGSETMACTYTQEHPPEDGYKTAYTWGRFAMI